MPAYQVNITATLPIPPEDPNMATVYKWDDVSAYIEDPNAVIFIGPTDPATALPAGVTLTKYASTWIPTA